MNFNRRLKFVFIHTPRTGGMSFKATGLLDEWKGHHGIQELTPKLRSFFKFGFCRHPLDRFVSAYHVLRDMEADGPWANAGYNPDLSFLTKALDFDTFVQYFRTSTWVKDTQLFIPQHKFLVGSGWKKLDFLGRFEDLIGCWQYIYGKIGIIWSGFPCQNVSNHRCWKDYYNPYTAGVIMDHYSEDMRLFYAKEMKL